MCCPPQTANAIHGLLTLLCTCWWEYVNAMVQAHRKELQMHLNVCVCVCMCAYLQTASQTWLLSLMGLSISSHTNFTLGPSLPPASATPSLTSPGSVTRTRTTGLPPLPSAPSHTRTHSTAASMQTQTSMGPAVSQSSSKVCALAYSLPCTALHKSGPCPYRQMTTACVVRSIV